MPKIFVCPYCLMSPAPLAYHEGAADCQVCMRKFIEDVKPALLDAFCLLTQHLMVETDFEKRKSLAHRNSLLVPLLDRVGVDADTRIEAVTDLLGLRQSPNSILFDGLAAPVKGEIL